MTTTMLNKLCIYDHVSLSSSCLKGFLLGQARGEGGGGTEVFLQTYRKVSSAFKQRLKTSL